MLNRIILLILITLPAVSSKAYSFVGTDSLAVEQEQMFSDSLFVADTLLLPDTLCNDTVVFDVPESLVCDLDSMLNSWQARNLLNIIETSAADTVNVKVSDTVYAERLRSLPVIVNMPFNYTVPRNRAPKEDCICVLWHRTKKRNKEAQKDFALKPKVLGRKGVLKYPFLLTYNILEK